MSKFRLFLTISYLGTKYRGWQTQRQGEVTIQQTIQDALKKIYGLPISVTASGRTDTGVHAEGQIAHITPPDHLDIDKLQRALNAILPWDIRIRQVRQVHPHAHARKDALSKIYRYQLWVGKIVPPFLYPTWHHFTQKISTDKLRQCAERLPGNHDFGAFTTHPKLYATTVREIVSTSINREGDGVILHVEGRGFMRHMVRRLVGSMVEVARGKRELTWFESLIHEAPPAGGGPTAPAKGLILESVSYPATCYNDDMDDDSTQTGSVVAGDDHQGYTRKDLDIRLMVLQGEQKGKVYPLPFGITVIGRLEGEIKIPDSKISRKHAVLEILGPNIYYLKDLASSNGTFVNERAVTLTKLTPGDIIRVGDTVLKFYVVQTS
ncbi:MAG TPA: tRNA pseudouridine(38-40) synthase TruA [Thermoanaerobaculia bacterium]|nr:tRNA pseudouridine(38-40) synthase TruA [Thermoanaerobaculia bacterium]HUM30290.1 tRNA pseudouridine(38-40) synthase TruA [Thermoanaerobaculia bacterium]HXK68414.1 tRNA pseudouridine(38-40) synthase TruA [Thermoanaerobaculia bacterium]